MQICDAESQSPKSITAFIIADIGRCLMVSLEIAGKRSMVITKAVKCSEGTQFNFAMKFLYDVRQIT